jgi:hypothetical protein
MVNVVLAKKKNAFSQVVYQVPAFYVCNPNLTAHHWILPEGSVIQSTTSHLNHSLIIRFSLLFRSNLRLGLPKRFPTKILYVFLISTMRARSAANLTLLPLIILVGIATGYGLDGLGSIPGRGKIFLFCTSSRPTLGSTKPPTQWIP